MVRSAFKEKSGLKSSASEVRPPARKDRTLLFLPVVLMVLLASSCGSDQTTVTTRLSYASGVEAQVLQSGVTARIWYRSSSTGTDVTYQPAQSLPTTTPGTVNGQSVSVPEPHTASAEGFTVTSGASIDLRALPLNRVGIEVGIEFMKVVNGQPYVFAYGIYQGPTDQRLSEAQLKADLVSGLAIYFGRSCGQFSKQQCRGSMPTDAQLQENCDSSPPRYPSNNCS